MSTFQIRLRMPCQKFKQTIILEVKAESLILLMSKNLAEKQIDEIKVDRDISEYETNKNANYVKEFQEMMKQYKELESTTVELRKTKEFIANVLASYGVMKKPLMAIGNSFNTHKDKNIKGNSQILGKLPKLVFLVSLIVLTGIIVAHLGIKMVISDLRKKRFGYALFKLTNAAAEERSKYESTRIELYQYVVINEIYRLMKSIDIVVHEAKHLFGLERTQIFFDLAAKLFNFGSAEVISTFVPNMAESKVRQNVISFFSQSCDMMNLLMTLLSSCPDRKRIQQMPEQNFISLINSIFESFLKTKTKGREKLSSEGNTFIMVDSEEFKRVLGEEIAEYVLDRPRHGNEMVVHSFVDGKFESTQASERKDNRIIHSIYFPSDCRLFIYIPTEIGSYWHHLDMQRANRISQLADRTCDKSLSIEVSPMFRERNTSNSSI